MEDELQKAEMEQRIAELERRLSKGGVEPAFWALMHRLFPDEARKHLRAAGREQLLAARVYIDQWIARMDAEDQEPRRRHEKIEVE